jgi:hypothetical protein
MTPHLIRMLRKSVTRLEAHLEHHHHSFVAPSDFFAGGGCRRKGGFGYGIQTEWTGTGYSLSKGPLTALPYYPAIYGGVPDKFCKIDHTNHLACKDYYKEVGFIGMVKYTLMSGMFRFTVSARLLSVFGPIVLLMLYIRQFEPVEAKMDRETFFRDFEANYYGAYFDHHAFHHKLAKRRAKKWGYEDQVHLDDHAHHAH